MNTQQIASSLCVVRPALHYCISTQCALVATNRPWSSVGLLRRVHPLQCQLIDFYLLETSSFTSSPAHLLYSLLSSTPPLLYSNCSHTHVPQLGQSADARSPPPLSLPPLHSHPPLHLHPSLIILSTHSAFQPAKLGQSLRRIICQPLPPYCISHGAQVDQQQLLPPAVPSLCPVLNPVHSCAQFLPTHSLSRSPEPDDVPVRLRQASRAAPPFVACRKNPAPVPR